MWGLRGQLSITTTSNFSFCFPLLASPITGPGFTSLCASSSLRPCESSSKYEYLTSASSIKDFGDEKIRSWKWVAMSLFHLYMCLVVLWCMMARDEVSGALSATRVCLDSRQIQTYQTFGKTMLFCQASQLLWPTHFWYASLLEQRPRKRDLGPAPLDLSQNVCTYSVFAVPLNQELTGHGVYL